ncbi:MAG: hypothetical protein B7X40_03255, partial [Cellulomonas sp. 14-74-6]
MATGSGVGRRDHRHAGRSRRATAAGLHLLVDFHCSDFWADPSKQRAPKAWAGYSVAQRAAAVGAYTTVSLQKLKAADVDVGMVQVGNETNHGVAGVNGRRAVSQVFSAGSAAVRAVFPGPGRPRDGRGPGALHTADGTGAAAGDRDRPDGAGGPVTGRRRGGQRPAGADGGRRRAPAPRRLALTPAGDGRGRTALHDGPSRPPPRCSTCRR